MYLNISNICGRWWHALPESRLLVGYTLTFDIGNAWESYFLVLIHTAFLDHEVMC
jgi:hypothetical protein